MRSGFSATSAPRRGLALVLALAFLAAAVFAAPAVAAGRTSGVISDFPVRASLLPNDPLFIDQWGLRSVQADDAWDVMLGNRSVVVAVVDTGVWWTHGDIRGNMWSNTDGTHGYDFIDGDTNPMDEDAAGGTFHGTGVAGVIAALTNNGNDIAGAAQVSVMALRALGANGEGSSFNTSQAIRWAADRGARVINLSLGTNGTFGGPTDLQLAIDYAWRRGALIVAAAGNSGASSLDFPARLPNVVSVAALDENGRRASYSNYGSGLDISAPGTRILTLTSNNQIHYLSGTSLAAPFVTAAAALLLSLEPTLTNFDLWNLLNDTADPVGSGYNTQYGWGEVNFWSAINALGRPFISVNNFPTRVARSAAFGIGWTILGPAGLAVSDTHVEWGTVPGVLGNATPAQTGMTRDSYTAPGLTIPAGSDVVYFRVVATVNGTTYDSQELSVAVSNLPEFVQALYDLLASNLLYLAVFVLALAAIVAFLPQRRARARRRTYYARTMAPRTYRAVAPPSEPPPARITSPAHEAPMIEVAPAAQRTPGYYSQPPAAPAQPLRPAPAAPAHAVPTKKRCPQCGTAVNADNMFCFFCGTPFR
ncbi:MAG: S8 family serine peptidase [Methanobacteriota archaeon]